MTLSASPTALSASVEDARFLRLSGELMSRTATDPQFFAQFNTDPAGALQELFPELRHVPKATIAAELSHAHAELVKFAIASENIAPAALAGFVAAVSRVATKAATRVTARSLATAALQSVSASLVGQLLAAQFAAPPPPE